MRLLVIFIVGLMFGSELYSQTPIPVRDKSTYGLWKAIYAGKKDCRPEWMFTLIPSWKRYRSNNMTNAQYLMPAWYAVYENREHAEEELEYRADHADEQIHDGLDRVAKVQWHTFYKVRIELAVNLCVNNIWKIEEAAESDYLVVENYVKDKLADVISEYSQALRVIIDYYQAVNQSYIPDSKKREAYNKALEEMNVLQGRALQDRKRFIAYTSLKEVEFLKNGEL